MARWPDANSFAPNFLVAIFYVHLCSIQLLIVGGLASRRARPRVVAACLLEPCIRAFGGQKNDLDPQEHQNVTLEIGVLIGILIRNDTLSIRN